MTVLNFPGSPSVNDVYEVNGVVYTWTGSYWEANSGPNATLDTTYVEVAGDTMTGALNVPAGASTTQVPQVQEVVLKAGDTMTGDLTLADCDLVTTLGGTERARITQNGAGVFVNSVQSGGNPAAGAATGTAIAPGGILVVSRPVSPPQDALQVFATGGAANFTVKSNGELSCGGPAYLKGIASHAGSSGTYATNLYNFYWTGAGGGQLWIDTTLVGQISVTSDYRTKKNITPMSDGAVDRVKQLKPCTFSRAEFAPLFTNDDTIREGFIAHELQGVIPSAVDGEKDADHQIQSLNLDALVSVLTKALQEALERIETLEAKVTSLEG